MQISTLIDWHNSIILGIKHRKNDFLLDLGWILAQFPVSNDRKPLNKPSKTVKNRPFWTLKILFLQKINSVNQWLNIDLPLFNA